MMVEEERKDGMEEEDQDHPVCSLEPQDRFLTACTTGDGWQVAECLASPSLLVNSPGVDSLTGLMLAARGGHTDLVIQLMERDDCDINICDKVYLSSQLTITSHLSCQDGDTALSHACCCGHQDIVTALLCSPLLNINTTDTDRVTPLHKAIANNHVDIVSLLLQQPLLEVWWCRVVVMADQSRPHILLLSDQCTEQIRLHGADTGGRDG